MSFWGKLGKIALKAAPIAANFIPGVGPLASMGIQAGLGALDKKVSGGSWKDALVSGGINAGLSKIPIKGLGPSGSPTDYVGKDIAKVASRGANKGFKSALGGFARQLGKSALEDPSQFIPMRGQAVPRQRDNGGLSPSYAVDRGPDPMPDLSQDINAGIEMERNRRRKLGLSLAY